MASEFVFRHETSFQLEVSLGTKKRVRKNRDDAAVIKRSQVHQINGLFWFLYRVAAFIFPPRRQYIPNI